MAPWVIAGCWKKNPGRQLGRVCAPPGANPTEIPWENSWNKWKQDGKSADRLAVFVIFYTFSIGLWSWSWKPLCCDALRRAFLLMLVASVFLVMQSSVGAATCHHMVRRRTRVLILQKYRESLLPALAAQHNPHCKCAVPCALFLVCSNCWSLVGWVRLENEVPYPEDVQA